MTDSLGESDLASLVKSLELWRKGSVRAWGLGEDRRPWVELRADASDVARALKDAGVRVKVGLFQYPMPDEVEPLMMQIEALGGTPAETLSVSVHLVLESDVVKSGQDGAGSIILTNIASSSRALGLERNATGYVVDSVHGRLVVGGGELPRHGSATKSLLDPSQSVVVGLSFGTASRDPSLGYCLPPGDYSVVGVVNVRPPGSRRVVRVTTAPASLSIV